MPIILPAGLPAAATLAAEGFQAEAADTLSQRGDRRPLRVALVNLMPHKPVTETQFARLLAGTPFRVDLSLVAPASYTPTTTPAAHMRAFYRPWPAVREETFDGLIVTGAPVERMPFEAVAYWPELARIIDWAAARVGHTLYVCWAAQAALYHAHGVDKHMRPSKLFGIYDQEVADPAAPAVHGLAPAFPTPVSRHTEVREAELPPGRGLAVLARSPQAGLSLVEDRPRRALYMFNHLEYDADTLAREYRRDLTAGEAIAPPVAYFPDDNPDRAPVARWRPHARRFFANWLGQAADAARTTAATA